MLKIEQNELKWGLIWHENYLRERTSSSFVCSLHSAQKGPFFVEGPEYYCNVNSQYYPFKNAYFYHY